MTGALILYAEQTDTKPVRVIQVTRICPRCFNDVKMLVAVKGAQRPRGRARALCMACSVAQLAAPLTAPRTA